MDRWIDIPEPSLNTLSCSLEYMFRLIETLMFNLQNCSGPLIAEIGDAITQPSATRATTTTITAVTTTPAKTTPAITTTTAMPAPIKY